jgi:hypothetical protein
LSGQDFHRLQGFYDHDRTAKLAHQAGVAEAGQLGQDLVDKTTRIEQLGQDSWDMTAEQENQDRMARKDSQDRAARAEQPE